ncbi:polyribonucleotide nucleotidyltransferase [Pseudomonas sp. W2-17]|uniref:polyribonucleotide nucleotidyltransferase n=1 Tax=Pseudomonas sp. W2-17 TaxID=3058039 RepID=UPI0034E0B42B
MIILELTMLNKWNLPVATNRSLKKAALNLTLSLAVTMTVGVTAALAASPPAEAQSSYTAEQASMLGGKLSFSVPSGYVQQPETQDPRATAMGVTSASYLNKAEKSLLITAQVPLAVDADSDNDQTALSGMVTGTEMQQTSDYKDYKKLGEKSIVKANGLGLRQLDASMSLADKPMLATTVAAASGTRSAIVTVLTNADNPKGHAALVKTVIGE